MDERETASLASFSPANEHVAKVLLVDDQATTGRMIRRSLVKQPNIEFFHCINPDEAVAFAERVNPTLILQDLQLPRVSGLALLQKYRTNPSTRKIPVIMLSVEERPAIKREAFALGANDYMVKPPDPVELIARIWHHSTAYSAEVRRDQAFEAMHEREKQLLATAAELRRQNNIDGLTGLNNRRYLDEYLAVEWKRAAREQKPLSVLMIDVDEFKRYNDTYGHPAGDTALRSVAAAIRECFGRPGDVVARYGGEEFMAVLPNTPLVGARHLAAKIARNVETLQIEHATAAVVGYVTVSVGFACAVPSREGQPATLIKMADTALYEAKRMGKNRAVAYVKKDASSGCDGFIHLHRP